ncbi:MAG: amidohydrolase family protein [Muribaculaceae bacterium]|nr:amidohydrolase family protein [Muribaculaceae bacterium]
MHHLFENGGKICLRDLYVENGIISDVTEPQNNKKEIVNGLIVPKFFNLHCHLGENTFRNIVGDAWTLSKYLSYTENYCKNIGEEERTALWQQSAISVINESKSNNVVGLCASGCARLCKQYDMLNMSAYSITSLIKAADNPKEREDLFKNYYMEYNNAQCSIGASLHSIYKSDKETLVLARNVMDWGAEFFTVHISEDYNTTLLERNKFGKSPVEVLDDYNLLGERTLLVHCGYISEKDYELIAKRGCMIVVCPISNAFLNTQTVDVCKLDCYGIKWTVGTDGLATGRSFNLIAQCVKLKKSYPELELDDLLYKITVVAAEFYNRSIYTGRIEKGTKADFILIDDVCAYSRNRIFDRLL